MRKIYIILILTIFQYIAYSREYSAGINIPSIAMANISVIGEYYINNNSSVNMGIGLRPRIPLNDESIYFNLKGISLTPAYRYYLNGKAEYGFFIGAYLRYQYYTTGVFYNDFDFWSGLTINKYDGLYQKEFGVGITVGYRFALDKYAFDIFIGPRFSKHKFEFRYYHLPNETNSTFIGDVDELFTISIPGTDKYTYESTYNYDKVTIPAKLPGLRIGFTFNYYLNFTNEPEVSEYEKFYY